MVDNYTSFNDIRNDSDTKVELANFELVDIKNKDNTSTFKFVDYYTGAILELPNIIRKDCTLVYNSYDGSLTFKLNKGSDGVVYRVFKTEKDFDRQNSIDELITYISLNTSLDKQNATKLTNSMATFLQQHPKVALDTCNNYGIEALINLDDLLKKACKVKDTQDVYYTKYSVDYVICPHTADMAKAANTDIDMLEGPIVYNKVPIKKHLQADGTYKHLGKCNICGRIYIVEEDK